MASEETDPTTCHSLRSDHPKEQYAVVATHMGSMFVETIHTDFDMAMKEQMDRTVKGDVFVQVQPITHIFIDGEMHTLERKDHPGYQYCSKRNMYDSDETVRKREEMKKESIEWKASIIEERKKKREEIERKKRKKNKKK